MDNQNEESTVSYPECPYCGTPQDKFKCESKAKKCEKCGHFFAYWSYRVFVCRPIKKETK